MTRIGIPAATVPPGTYAQISGTNPFQKTGKTGFVGIETDGDASVSSVLGQATAPNGQMRFRVSRATQDTYHGQHFQIVPYAYGMSFEYLGLTQFNTATFGVGAAEPYTSIPGAMGPGYGGVVLAFNQGDTGGLWLTSTDQGLTATGSAATPVFSSVISQSYAYGDGGPLRFITRGASGFQFLQGAANAERQIFTLDRFGQALFSGSLTSPAQAGNLTVYGQGGVLPTATLFANTGQTGDILQVSGQVPGIFSRYNKNGVFMTRVGTAPVLADMVDGETAISRNAGGDLIITSRVAGALKTATVAVA